MRNKYLLSICMILAVWVMLYVILIIQLFKYPDYLLLWPSNLILLFENNIQRASPFLQIFLIYAWIWLIPTLVYILIKSPIEANNVNISLHSKIIEKNTSKKLLCMVIASSTIISIGSYLIYGSPVGPDAYLHISTLEWLYNNPEKSFSAVPFGFFSSYYITFAPFFPFRAIDLSWESIFIIISVTFSMAYMFTIYYFIKIITSDRFLAVLSTLVAATSIISSILFLNSFRNLYAIMLFYVLLALFIKVTRQPKLPSISLFLLLSGYATIQYQLYSLPILALTIFIFILFNVRDVKYLKNSILIVGFMLASFLITVLIVNPRMINLPIEMIRRSELAIGGGFSINWIALLESSWHRMINENVIVILLSLFGLVWLTFHYSNNNSYSRDFFQITLAQTLAVSIIFIFIQDSRGFRLIWWFPIPMLVGVALHRGMHLITKIYFSDKRIKLKNIIITVTLLTLLILSNQTIVRLQTARFFAPYSSNMPSDLTEAIWWVRENFSKEETVIIMREVSSPPTGVHYLYAQWLSYFLNIGLSNFNVYMGDLRSFIKGEPSKPISPDIARGLAFETPVYNLSIFNTILVSGNIWGTLYNVNEFEKVVLDEIYRVNGIAVYKLEDYNSKYLQRWMDVEDKLRNKELDYFNQSFINNFDNEWVSNGCTLKGRNHTAEITADNGVQHIWIERSIPKIVLDQQLWYFSFNVELEESIQMHIVIWNEEKEKFIKEIQLTSLDEAPILENLIDITNGSIPSRFIISFEGNNIHAIVHDLLFFDIKNIVVK